jgi:two-component system OmpR family response regulator
MLYSEDMEESQTILIVEDDTELREALTTALTYEKFSVLAADNGATGLGIALEKHPDLILLDVIMPHMDGLTVLQKLREDAWGKEVPVIVMTVLDDLEKIAAVVTAGGDEYVIKSDVTLGTLVGKVKERLARANIGLQKPHK